MARSVKVTRDEDPHAASFAAWTCALAPDAVDDYAPIIALAHRAVDASPQNTQCVKTLAAILFRAGQIEAAIEKLTEVQELAVRHDGPQIRRGLLPVLPGDGAPSAGKCGRSTRVSGPSHEADRAGNSRSRSLEPPSYPRPPPPRSGGADQSARGRGLGARRKSGRRNIEPRRQIRADPVGQVCNLPEAANDTKSDIDSPERKAGCKPAPRPHWPKSNRPPAGEG